MLDSHPKDLGGADKQKLLACIDACFECAQACAACADACLSEDMVAELTTCIPGTAVVTCRPEEPRMPTTEVSMRPTGPFGIDRGQVLW